MQNNDKKYFIQVDGNPIEVSEEVYRAFYQPIWNTRYHAQKNGECRCTKAQLWKCDGVCPGCPFYAAGKKVSIDTPIGGEDDELTLGDTLADDTPSAESILMDKELLDALYDELNDIANWLTGAFSGTDEAAPSPEPEKTLTLEEVRAILAEKSRDGFTAQIRDLLLKYGAKKLSEVDPASYKALVADAEVLGNG